MCFQKYRRSSVSLPLRIVPAFSRLLWSYLSRVCLHQLGIVFQVHDGVSLPRSQRLLYGAHI